MLVSCVVDRLQHSFSKPYVQQPSQEGSIKLIIVDKVSMDTNTGTTTAASDVIQVLKQPTSEATVVNSAQIPSQSLSVAVMQQAVALQQFQFQQALMMQQILAQQQAASRAVNVKTASELAVARAAEISKLLKGESANDEKGNSDEAGLQSLFAFGDGLGLLQNLAQEVPSERLFG